MPKKVEVEWFYDNLQDFIELTPKKDALFIIGDWKAKVESMITFLLSQLDCEFVGCINIQLKKQFIKYSTYTENCAKHKG